MLGGDNTSFSILVKNTEALVAQIVFKMVTNADDRKDLVQDIYFNAYKNLHNFRFQSRLSTWIGSIAYHSCYNYLKKKKLLLLEKSQDDEMETSPLETKINRFINYSTSETMEYIFKKELRVVLQIGIDQLSPILGAMVAVWMSMD